jgi:urea transport system substrate-binding protein
VSNDQPEAERPGRASRSRSRSQRPRVRSRAHALSTARRARRASDPNAGRAPLAQTSADRRASAQRIRPALLKRRRAVARAAGSMCTNLRQRASSLRIARRGSEALARALRAKTCARPGGAGPRPADVCLALATRGRWYGDCSGERPLHPATHGRRSRRTGEPEHGEFMATVTKGTRWVALAALLWLHAAAAASAAETIKVGILHSLSGTMAISETSLKDVALMTIESINAKGGVLGKRLEPVVVDPASNWPLFAEKARELLTVHEVAVVFGCWTSVSRKSVLPVFEELNGLLFYPVQYEGEESSYNVFYTGAAPNQQAIPAVEYLMSEDGGGAKRWVLLGTDYVYPRTTNKILRYFLTSKGVKEADIMEEYTPFGHSDYQTIVANVKKFAAGGPTAVVSTINGDSNVPFYKELAAQGIRAEDIPVVAFSVGEEELRGIDTKPLVGHLAAWNYFMSIENPTNAAFIEEWKAYVAKNKLPGGEKRVTNDPMEATWIGIQMWKQAVEQAGTTNIDAVRQAIGGQKVMAPSGYEITMDAKNHHLHKPVVIGEVTEDGQFEIVWQTKGPVRAEAWSPFIPDSKKKVADWTYPWVCGNCTAAKFE